MCLSISDILKSAIRENSGLYSFDCGFVGGGIENFKNLEGGHR
jgi:hypothetical protein